MKTNRVFPLNHPAVIFCALTLLTSSFSGFAQVNSGSDGSDGALDLSVNTFSNNVVIDMRDHPSGVYKYIYVNVPSGKSVSFIPNANNSPVTWLVQSNTVINGNLVLNGADSGYGVGGVGGPGGFRGGNSGANATPGYGLGGGPVGTAGGASGSFGGNASYGTLGITNSGIAPGPIYGNNFLVPLQGGSGGGGATGAGYGGGGGGGAMLIASSTIIQLNGEIQADGGAFYGVGNGGFAGGGYGSGGAVRLVAQTITGSGTISVRGYTFYGQHAGNGRIRFDCYVNNFTGNTYGALSQGSQFVVIPAGGSGTELSIVSVGGVSVSASPSGLLTTPDAILSGQQSNPIAVVVQCSNIPLGTPITVTVTPASGSAVSASANNTGTVSSSTATVLVNIPRGGGYISASAAIGN